jgi:hypothetical protein
VLLFFFLLLCRYESEVALQTRDVTLDESSNEFFDALGINPESIERLAPEYLRRFREGSHYKQVCTNIPRPLSHFSLFLLCLCRANQSSHHD